MVSSLPPGLLQVASVTRDTIVTLTMPAERTAFDVASGSLQIIVLLVGLVALIATAVSALALRQAVLAMQTAAERLTNDARPLIEKAARVSEEAGDVVRLVRREAERLAEASGAVSDRLLDVSDMAEERLDEVNALLDVLQDEVEETALSAAAAVRGLRVGASALGAAIGGTRGPRRARRRRGDSTRLDPSQRPYFADDEDAEAALDDEEEHEAALDADGQRALPAEAGVEEEADGPLADEPLDALDDAADHDVDPPRPRVSRHRPRRA